MTPDQKELILESWEYCDEEDKSTEFMLHYMSEVSGVDYDDVVEYVTSHQAEHDRTLYYTLKNNGNTKNRRRGY